MIKKPKEIKVIKPSEEDQIQKKKALEVWDRARMELLTWRPFSRSIGDAIGDHSSCRR